MRKIKTSYEFREGWQYQDIYVDLDTLNLIREQNYNDNGVIASSEDIFTPDDKGYDWFWTQYGKQAVIDTLAQNMPEEAQEKNAVIKNDFNLNEIIVHSSEHIVFPGCSQYTSDDIIMVDQEEGTPIKVQVRSHYTILG